MSRQMGNALRAIRKEKGLRIADLVEKGLSSATISFIEQGKSVKESKLHRYCEKLGIQPAQFPHLVEHQQKSHSQLQMHLSLLESKIQLHLEDSSLLAELRKLEKQGEMLSTVYFLKGLYYFNRKNWDRSRKYLERVVETAAKQKDFTSNLIASAYKELARISFFQKNDLKAALHYVQLGLDGYDSNGERAEIKFFLMIGKVIYLEKLNRIDDALHTLDILWDEYAELSGLEVLLNMYEIKASLLNRKKDFNKAIKYAVEGYRLASKNKSYRRAVELLTTWGNILTNLEDYRNAEQIYLLALEFKIKKKIEGNNLFVSTYTHLGLLYSKQKQVEKARDYFEKAIKEGKQSKDAPRYCFALMSFADFESNQRKFPSAVLYYEEAKNLAKDYHLENYLEVILVHLADCWKKAGEKDRYIRSLEEVQKLLLLKGGENIG
ncbi:tetratricopeptide repeat protein [Shimazuella sp. AN120528]|uniref:helix-turn-helix domain-containing protein n=1 Tax=Shimazuella soli TaxID=1892854 RepID=UPI001F0DBC92|nr:XRE family transcriptional regulator [Shimazuella soli]MCH5584079.1 tetratricopeptide repeat protein [Shimazuella soli]